ncbi:hypothetical protein T8J41_13945 [Nitratireductor rhodophyticola]|uniref:phage tail assembly chaperone n=1 Tax=Nitratireductor rhodophyticola TaxID=2854036 RepID=UPI002AC96628|nr:hypothetical protein [Nitratireductor rhodophyticola]WPZ13258.1 hypothetical protein T8J41_13945 [Nitratireductor rhodophyticola]
MSMGAGPVPFASIDAYARRFGYRGDAFDDLVSGIKAMDRAFIEFHEPDEDGKPKKRQAVSSRPMTPSLFKALFG